MKYEKSVLSMDNLFPLHLDWSRWKVGGETFLCMVGQGGMGWA